MPMPLPMLRNAAKYFVKCLSPPQGLNFCNKSWARTMGI